MAEEKMYTIQNMCRAQSSKAQRAVATTQHRAVLRIDGRVVLPKRPIKISATTFKLLEDTIIKNLREGRLAFTTPENYFVDSRPDGRIYVKRPGMQIVEEKEISTDNWRLLFEKPAAPADELPVPLKDWVGPGPSGDAGLAGPPGMTGPDCGQQSLGPSGSPGAATLSDLMPPVVDNTVVAEVKPEEPVPTATSEEVTEELPDPDATLTLDTPSATPVEGQVSKNKKRRHNK
jgi:hypothetical protein